MFLAHVLAGCCGLVVSSAQTPPAQPKPAASAQQGQPGLQGQQPGQQPATGQQPAAGTATTFTDDRLEQLVAPIALYPDGVLAQVLMAATYPIEIVEAARWVQKNPKLTGDKLEAALKEQDWEPSVKSLCGLPEVLKLLNEDLDWTQDLGDAFLSQKARLMDAVQVMRRKAFEAGNLKTGEQIKVTEQEDKILVVENTKTEVVYVPTYYPTAVYGSWGYPTYYYPPMYPPAPAGGMFLSFTAGVIWGAAIWGGCNWGWGHTDVDIDINRQNNFERNVNRDGPRNTARPTAGSRESWNHDPQHRKGAGYKDKGVAQRYGAAGGTNRVTRDQARGFAGSSGMPTAGTGAVGGQRPGAGTGAAARPQPATRPSGAGGATGSRPSPSTGQRSGSFSGSRSPSMDRASSARGSASRSGSMGGRSGGAARGGGGRR